MPALSVRSVFDCETDIILICHLFPVSDYREIFHFQLTRMDGIHVDTQVHWRAGMNTFGGRADLVIPFLLNTNETHDTLGVAAADTSPPRPKNTVSKEVPESKVSAAVGLDESCPWCGADTLSTETMNATLSYTKTDGCSLEGRDGVRNESGELVATSYAREPAGSARDALGDGRSSRRSSCASCGFTLPDMNLWSVSESRPVRFPLNWEGVCLAGDRWRDGFCRGVSVRDTIEPNKEEQMNESTFRNACLRARAERTSMRRRHRREERDLAASLDINGAEPRGVNGGVASTSRMAYMEPSGRRLEAELDLGDQHAEERRGQAARQLCFHGGGVERGGVDNTGGTCVMVDLRPLATEGHRQEQTDDLPDAFKNRRSHTSPAKRQSRAARVIQQLWHRHQELAAPPHVSPSRRGLEVGTREPAKEQAVTKLQSAFRGFHVRRALQVSDWTTDLRNFRRGIVSRQLFTRLETGKRLNTIASRVT